MKNFFQEFKPSEFEIFFFFPVRAHSLGGLAADAGAYPGETAVSGCGSRVASGKSDTV